MKMKSKSGFTLVELMVVAVIVAILAAVAIPLMSGNKKRAMATEAEAGLGTARSCMRAMYAESKDYTKNPNSATAIAGGNAITVIPGVNAGDFDGKYFNTANYTIESIGASAYSLMCSGGTGDVSGITIKLSQDGTWTRTGI